MLQPSGQPDLPLKPFGAQRDCQLGVEDLESHGTVVTKVAREKDGRHAAATELALDGVAVGEGLAQAPFTLHPSPPFTSFWNRGFFRSESRVGSILSQPGVRK